MMFKPDLNLSVDHEGGSGGTVKIWENERFWLSVGQYGGVRAINIRDNEFNVYLTVGGELALEARGLNNQKEKECEQICLQAIDLAIAQNPAKFIEHARKLGRYEGKEEAQAAMRDALGL